LKPQNAARLPPCEAFGKNTGNFVRETNTALSDLGVSARYLFIRLFSVGQFPRAASPHTTHDRGRLFFITS